MSTLKDIKKRFIVVDCSKIFKIEDCADKGFQMRMLAAAYSFGP